MMGAIRIVVGMGERNGKLAVRADAPIPFLMAHAEPHPRSTAPPNRGAVIEAIIDADPVAARVREIMTERSAWAGTAADLLHFGVDPAHLRADTRWPNNPRALAGCLRRAQTFLRTLGIEIAFSREGLAGSQIIRIRKGLDATVSAVSTPGWRPRR